MKIETRSEAREHILAQVKAESELVTKPGRTLPLGHQWNGKDAKGEHGQAKKRRLRQLERKRARDEQAATVQGEETQSAGEEIPSDVDL